MRLLKDALEVRELSRRDRLDQARLRGRDRRPAHRAARARGGGHLQPARPRRGQRRRLRHHRRLGRARLHPPLDAQRRRRCGPARCSCSTPASRRTRSTPRTSPARCPISGTLQQGAAARSTSWSTRAQAAAFEQVKPGQRLHGARTARRCRCSPTGWSALGILDDAAEALADENQFYKRYSLHNVSHMLGLDVHDCAQARAGGLQVRQAQARHGAHRRARPLLPDRRPHRARASTAASACASRTTWW